MGFFDCWGSFQQRQEGESLEVMREKLTETLRKESILVFFCGPRVVSFVVGQGCLQHNSPHGATESPGKGDHATGTIMAAAISIQSRHAIHLTMATAEETTPSRVWLSANC